MQPSRQSSFTTVPSHHKCKWWLGFLAKSIPRSAFQPPQTSSRKGQFSSSGVQCTHSHPAFLSPASSGRALACPVSWTHISFSTWWCGRPLRAEGRCCFLGPWALTGPRASPVCGSLLSRPFSLLLPWIEAVSYGPNLMHQSWAPRPALPGTWGALPGAIGRFPWEWSSVTLPLLHGSALPPGSVCLTRSASKGGPGSWASWWTCSLWSP